MAGYYVLKLLRIRCHFRGSLCELLPYGTVRGRRPRQRPSQPIMLALFNDLGSLETLISAFLGRAWGRQVLRTSGLQQMPDSKTPRPAPQFRVRYSLTSSVLVQLLSNWSSIAKTTGGEI